jgi:hypothetical protein
MDAGTPEQVDDLRVGRLVEDLIPLPHRPERLWRLQTDHLVGHRPQTTATLGGADWSRHDDRRRMIFPERADRRFHRRAGG